VVNEDLRRQLIEMTQAFYRHHASSFSGTRQNPWASWQQIIDTIARTPTSVIDYGCGNGRFAGFLQQIGFDGDYLGVDSDDALLDIARSQQSGTFRAVGHPSEVTETAELVIAFGVLHHIPGSSNRRDFMATLARLVSPSGYLVASFWRPEELRNFASKSSADHGMEGLETGDHLLGWNGDFSHLRYCHHFESSEIDELSSTTGLQEVTRFNGSGNDATNTYLVSVAGPG
jgi:tRNA (uracil-5-)-methyltransferase TRM9